jgi:oligosaccharide reducing-end xylanase
VTGLNPDYAEFDGAPKHRDGHGDFRFDAFRTAVNWSVDYAWWAADPNEKVLTDRLQAFFASQGMETYVNQYTLDGRPLSTDRSTGLIASNGAASLAATDPRAWEFVEALWELTPPSGQWRYYDGLLQFMATLHASGNFRIYAPQATPP